VFLQRRKIILASRSPARRQILIEAGLKLDVKFPDIDESRLLREPVSRYAVRVAHEKARKIAEEYSCHPRRECGDPASPLDSRLRGNDFPVVIGVDTIIALGNKIFGKPSNREEAKKFLRALSGRWHKVYSGTVVIDTIRNKTIKKLVVSKVRFTKLSEDMIDWYVSTGEPLRVAGAYAIQWKGMALIEAVNGCFTNVIGISIPVLMGMLKKLKAV